MITNLVLGALFHDIGKFKQRASLPEDKGKSHVEIGHSWLISQYGEGLISSGARNHHGNEPETWQSNLGLLFYEADNCAASERKTEYDPARDIGKEWQRTIPLANVFSRVRNPAIDIVQAEEGNSQKPPPPSYIPLQPLGTWVVPTREEIKITPQDYARLWKGFETDFASIRSSDNHFNIDVILHLLEKYTSAIPSITLKIYGDDDEETYRKHPDVSLFDHLKMTAAITLCLYHYYCRTYTHEWERNILLNLWGLEFANTCLSMNIIQKPNAKAIMGERISPLIMEVNPA